MLNNNALETNIKENLEQVNERIAAAAASVGRSAREITLIVVSKRKEISTIRAAIQAGITDFGENYPEQAVEKIEALKDMPKVRWHMIGHLQSRKSNLVAEHFDTMHSLDSLKLAGRLEKLLSEKQKLLPVMLEFNVAGESSKHGWNAQNESDWPALLPEIAPLLALPSLQVMGLMCMPPYAEDSENSRSYYVKLVKLRDFFAEHFPQQTWHELSMGTSFDFEVAIQEGATFIRVGQAILGPRP
jgi:PLP dependent protein